MSSGAGRPIPIASEVLPEHPAARAWADYTQGEVLPLRDEGVLRGEFRLPVAPGGAVVPVDDVLMAKAIAANRRVPGARERAP